MLLCRSSEATTALLGNVKRADRMKMATTMTRIADPEIKFAFLLLKGKTRQKVIYCALLLCFALFSTVVGQIDGESREFKQAQTEYDNGNYQKAIELAEIGIEKSKKLKDSRLISEGLDISASSQISLGKYKEAENNLNEVLRNISETEANASHRKALIYTRFAWLLRSQRKFAEALEYSKKAVAAAPNNRAIEAEHYFNVGRILFLSGYDISAVVWLEKAEKLLENDLNNPTRLDVYRFLTLAWSSKLNYPAALKYADKWVSFAEKSRFKHKHRQALLDSATLLSASGQKKKAFSALEKGLKLSIEQNSPYNACLFLTSLLLNTLENGDIVRASDYLNRLEKINADNQFSFEIKLGKAVISAFQGQHETSENLFAELDKMEKYSEFVLPYWKITVARKKQDWERLIKHSQEVLELATKSNYREDFPGIYLNFAEAYYRLNQFQKSAEYLEKSLSYVEEIRNSDNPNLSLGLSETYHKAYRLLAQIKFEKIQESFELADLLKARLLKDRINNAAVNVRSGVSPAVRKTLEELSLKYIDDQNLAAEIERYEKLVTKTTPELNLSKPDLTELDKISDFDKAAIVSYFYTLDKKLAAFVWEKGQPLKTIYLPVSEDEVDALAKATERKIKTFIFFKRDGKEIYDKLLKPLNLAAKHLIIVPDKSLWKIPFQALSADGEKYLIEERLISYAPSVSILLEQVKKPKPNRQTLQAFANPSFNNRFLQYVNDEAAQVAAIYNSKPVQNATVADFELNSDKADILHFSMHAEVDSELPLESFLGFRKNGAGDDGRLTVEELLKIRLKRGSLVFLASCDTNNVLSGEGLVSLAWAMMGVGATTVISAQWEANDKSTEIFTNTFYRHYKQGSSSAEATQKASLELIKSKTKNMHEPYFWADFSVNGDFR
jgi:CHAT domain-containing protein